MKLSSDLEEPIDVIETLQPAANALQTIRYPEELNTKNGNNFEYLSVDASIRSGSDEEMGTFKGGRSDSNFDSTRAESIVRPESYRKLSLKSSTDPLYNDCTYESREAAKHSNGYAYTIGIINPILTPVLGFLDSASLGRPASPLLDNRPEPLCDLKKEMIGSLTKAQRAVKLKKFIEKRKKRKWKRKPQYEGRKKAAETKLRINGRFISKEHAFKLLGKTSTASKGDTKATKILLIQALPEVKDPVFELTKVRMKETPATHAKYHNNTTKTLFA